MLCRVVQRIYRVFRISHCIYMYTCRVCFHGSVRKVEYDMKTLLWSDAERLMRLFFYHGRFMFRNHITVYRFLVLFS